MRADLLVPSLLVLLLQSPVLGKYRSEAEQLRQFLQANHASGSHHQPPQPRSLPSYDDSWTVRGREDPGHRFLNNKTQPFAVDGTKIPEVSFDVGESYAGLLPISNKTDEQDNLYFWFFPSVSEEAKNKKEIVIWLNGGPVSTGFAKGTPTVRNEDDVARQFMGFWKNFMDTFGMQGYKVYVVAESYGGRYGPYISSHFINANDSTYYNLGGLMIYDGLMFDVMVQQYAIAESFIEENRVVMPMSDQVMTYLRNHSEGCGFQDYMSKYLTFPPSGPAPLYPSWFEKSSNGLWEIKEGCGSLWDEGFYSMLEPNPCFNFYNIPDHCPLPADPIGGSAPYFDRTDVKTAINAPLDVSWSACASHDVFPLGDASIAPGLYELPNVIDKTKNVIIAQGGMDYILPPIGALLGIQNMTWGGKQGFQTRPTDPFYVPKYYEGAYGGANSYGQDFPSGMGVMGTTHHERGLIFVVTQLAGHQGPGYAPAPALRQLEKLLGRVHSLSDTQSFTLPALRNIPQYDKPLGKGTWLFPCFGKGC
ncbi:hypothetical protein PLIIFM63780_006589 [Purpureocillium lilacinum]|nr:hypothetical protein PLIIFM63780_006589 [Purpureocillium lilacinum]